MRKVQHLFRCEPLVLLAVLFLGRSLRTGSERDTERLLFTLVLVAQCRSESALLLLLSVPIIFGILKKPSTGRLRLRVTTVPLLLMPGAWQLRSLQAAGFYQVSPDDSLFGIHHLVRNGRGAWNYFTNPEISEGMLPVLFAAGLVGAALALVALVRHRSPPARSAFLPTVVGTYLVLEIVVISRIVP